MPAKPKGFLAELLDEAGKEPLVVSEDITIPVPSKGAIEEYALKQGEDRLRVIYGDTYDDLKAIFDELPFDKWQRFNDRVMEYFFGKGADKVEGK